MKKLLVLCALCTAAAGCRSWSDIFEERNELKLHVVNAQHAYHAGKWNMAVQQANKALDIDGDHTKALTLLGYCYLQVSRLAKDLQTRLEYFEKAEASFEKAILSGTEKDPAVFKAYFGLGLIYFMWAQEVKTMIEEASGKKPPGGDRAPDRESEEKIWSE